MKQAICMDVVRINVHVAAYPFPWDEMSKVSQIQQNKGIEEPGCSLAPLAYASTYLDRSCASICFNMIRGMFMPLSQHGNDLGIVKNLVEPTKQCHTIDTVEGTAKVQEDLSSSAGFVHGCQLLSMKGCRSLRGN